MSVDKTILNRAAGCLFLALGIVIGVTAVRMVFNGRRCVAMGRSALRAGDITQAVVWFEDAAKSYAPGLPHVEQALRELEIFTGAAEMRGEPEKAVAVWEVVRRSILATRHFVIPNADRLAVAEKEISRLRRKAEPESPWIASTGGRPSDSNPAASLVLFLGFCVWIAGSVGLIWLPSNQGGRNGRPRPAAWIACAGGLFIWVLMSVLA